MMISVRRRDDGLLTGLLSLLGWSSLFISRIVVFSLITTLIGYYIVILCLIHAVLMSVWIHWIAIKSYENQTNSWSTSKRLSHYLISFLLFGLPSLMIWPLMFQLKEKQRPLLYLIIITVQNFLLIVFWVIFQCNLTSIECFAQLNKTHLILVIVIFCTTLLALFFLTSYILCKPKYTDKVVYHDIKVAESEMPVHYGVYYVFCDLLFKIENSDEFSKQLKHIRL